MNYIINDKCKKPESGDGGKTLLLSPSYPNFTMKPRLVHNFMRQKAYRLFIRVITLYKIN